MLLIVPAISESVEPLSYISSLEWICFLLVCEVPETGTSLPALMDAPGCKYTVHFAHSGLVLGLILIFLFDMHLFFFVVFCFCIFLMPYRIVY
jgi:hypothetical protein